MYLKYNALTIDCCTSACGHPGRSGAYGRDYLSLTCFMPLVRRYLRTAFKADTRRYRKHQTQNTQRNCA